MCYSATFLIGYMLILTRDAVMNRFSLSNELGSECNLKVVWRQRRENMNQNGFVNSAPLKRSQREEWCTCWQTRRRRSFSAPFTHFVATFWRTTAAENLNNAALPRRILMRLHRLEGILYCWQAVNCSLCLKALSNMPRTSGNTVEPLKSLIQFATMWHHCSHQNNLGITLVRLIRF